MKQPASAEANRKHYKAGLICVAISFFLYALPLTFPARTYEGAKFIVFTINFTFVVGYGIWLANRLYWPNIPVFIVLFLISAYSLNRNMSVFEHSPVWLTAILILYGLTFLALPLYEKMPAWARALCCVLLGGATMLFLYLSAYLIPLYLFGVIGAFLLGISLHSFVPLICVVYAVYKTVKIARTEGGRFLFYILAGVLLSLTAVTAYTLQWQKINAVVRSAYQRSLMADKADLPVWVKVAQTLPTGTVTEQYLKGDLVYTTVDRGIFSFGWNMPTKNFSGRHLHNPLLVIAHLLSEPPELSLDERMNILEAMYRCGHNTQDRLWSGDDLSTKNVITNVRLWPSQRLAYTEKTITVSRNLHFRWMRQEAIYTFHVPEGSIVTSLSLWIDGKEQKGILTSKGKADSAYRQIVGVESRDPSVVHWQEGNTVLVRVFPVLFKESRIFKVGFTAPLSYRNGMLRYDNIWFEGPEYNEAKEIQQINSVGVTADPSMPAGFVKNAAHRYEREASYDEDWHLEFKDPGFEPASFAFDGHTYALNTYEQQRLPATFSKVYLDVNASWSAAELEAVWEIVKGKKVYIYDGSMAQMTNPEDALHLMKQRFSLFLFHSITDPASSLVVTKSTKYAPSLKMLKGFEFGDSLAAHINKPAPIKLFNIGDELSLYQRTLKEHRVFEYEQGNTDLLKQLLTSGTFAASIENDSTVTVDNAMIALSRTTTDATEKAGIDHVMRLFAYNNIMRQLKGNLYPESYNDSNLVAAAEQAYVVTPVSSLVVLESQKDYDRFGIKKSGNTLDNASMAGKGAVPEPHEWALILLAAAVLVWTYYGKRTAKTAQR